MSNVISVLIIEDEEIWANELQIMLTELGFNVAGVLNCVDDALGAIGKMVYDIVLVDIHLNGKNSGLEIGKMLYGLYHKPFIFITAQSDRHSLADAVNSNPSAYLIKPANKASLFVTIQAAIQNFNDRRTAVANAGYDTAAPSYFFTKQGNYFKKIEWGDVVYLTSERNYTKAVIKEDMAGYSFRSSLQKTMNSIIPVHMRPLFIQVNRAEVVNVSFIEQLQNNEVITAFGTFSIGTVYVNSVKKQLNILI